MPANSIRRATSAKQEQIPREETISLRERHVGKSCKLFFRSDPLKIVRARGNYRTISAVIIHVRKTPPKEEY